MFGCCISFFLYIFILTSALHANDQVIIYQLQWYITLVRNYMRNRNRQQQQQRTNQPTITTTASFMNDVGFDFLQGKSLNQTRIEPFSTSRSKPMARRTHNFKRIV